MENLEDVRGDFQRPGNWQDPIAVEHLVRVVEQTADLVMITNRAGFIEYVNPSFERVTGYKKFEVVGSKPNFLKSGEHPPALYQDLWQTILAGTAYQNEFTNKRKDGSIFHVEKTITPIRNDLGEITHFVSTDKDLTERRSAEKTTREYEKKFRDLFNFSKDAMAYCSIDGTLLEVNVAFERLTGYRACELVGKKTYQDLTTEAFHHIGEEYLARLLAQKRPVTYEKDYLKKSGEAVPVLLTAFPVIDESSERIIAIGTIAVDITERKKQERHLEEVNQFLKVTNESLQHFTTVAAHDLQSPLRTIRMHLDLLKMKTHLEAPALERIQFVTNAATKLYSLIQDLLAYSRVGMKIENLNAVDCEAVFDSTVKHHESSIRECNAIVSHSSLPVVRGESTQISLLFSNLLSNSLKYRNESPKIHFEAKREEGHWLFSVRDNGIGISPPDVKKLFVMFQRLHSEAHYPGTGIGLALCKKIVEAHDGKIWIESMPDEGTTVFFTLPSEEDSRYKKSHG